MRLAWFMNPDNVVYTTVEQFADNFGKETGISQLGEKIRAFKENPVKGGVVYQGIKRSSVKLFIPDMEFSKHIEMGEHVWLFIGEMYPAYCIYEY